MTGSEQEQTRHDVADARSEAEAILQNLRSLRDQIVTAWHERGVILDAEERVALRDEIKQTCDFLTDLTRGR